MFNSLEDKQLTILTNVFNMDARRIRKKKIERREQRLEIMLTPPELTELIKRAKEKTLSVSSYVRMKLFSQ